MRVITGQFKKRKLVDPQVPHIRPTKDSVKETMFNLCDHDFGLRNYMRKFFIVKKIEFK